MKVAGDPFYVIMSAAHCNPGGKEYENRLVGQFTGEYGGRNSSSRLRPPVLISVRNQELSLRNAVDMTFRLVESLRRVMRHPSLNLIFPS